MLTDEHKALLKEKLERERDTLVEELERLGARNPANPSDWMAAKPAGDEFGADRTDNAAVIDDMHTNNASLNELEGRLHSVTRALEKFANGTFGICEISHAPIEPERLDANPAARTSIAHMRDEHLLS